MSKYLYGAAIQGIQGFIFQTNELKDIVGASELVEYICTKDGLFEKYGKYNESILRAAGNIKHVFNTKEECANAVKNFPKEVLQLAHGITVSQAVVEIDEGQVFADVVDTLEGKLRAQRNRPMPSVTTGLIGIQRSRTTGLPAVDYSGGEYVDASTRDKKKKVNEFIKGEGEGTQRLCKKAFGEGFVSGRNVCYDIKDMTGCNEWIAIIHADGNGLGQIVQKIGKDADRFKRFSQALDEATQTAAVEAYRQVIKPICEEEHLQRIPLRPIVLGGDDLTVICRADCAVEYAAAFLKNFEEQTKERKKEMSLEAAGFSKLTACAGIAFVKSSYPFYYGYNLAETLCGQAKKDAKSINPVLAPSCLMFHKVQDSFVEDWKSISSRELTAKGGVSFEYGPYYIDQAGKPLVSSSLLDKVKLLDSQAGNAVKSHLRQWLTLMHEDVEIARQKAQRVSSMLSDADLKRFFDEATGWRDRDVKKFIVYDVLSIASVKFQDTTKKEEEV